MGSTADRFSRLAALRPARRLLQKRLSLETPGEEHALSSWLGGGVSKNHYGEHWVIRNWFSTPEFALPSPFALDLLVRVPVSRGRKRQDRARPVGMSRRSRAAVEDSERWLFLDTETTGLAGGTGTYAFLVGLAWWEAGGLQVEQLFLRDFSEEHSLLEELAARIAERPVLVTFNGKAFDWPLLENRFTMTRAIKVPELAAHLDLLHPARALWRLRLGSVRLVELERQVLDAKRLGWHREEDVPSSLIPQLYFDFLQGNAAQPLAGVVKHNQMDLRGLAALFGKINSLLNVEQRASWETDSRDLFGLSKYLDRRGENEWAQSACAQALGAGLPEEFRSQAKQTLARMAQRRGEMRRAAELWQELVTDPHSGVTACEQLAIHFERREHDLTRALEFAELGLAHLGQQLSRSNDPAFAARLLSREKGLVCRRERLRHRISKQTGLAGSPLRGRSGASGSWSGAS